MSTGFGAGMRHYRIGILEVVQSEKTFGATTSYRRAGKVSAAYKFNKGAKALREGALDAYDTVMIRMRYQRDMDRDSLIAHDGRVYSIQSFHRDYQENITQITAVEKPDLSTDFYETLALAANGQVLTADGQLLTVNNKPQKD
jgi:SPP1 family predicted phage head-tail adaptor